MENHHQETIRVLLVDDDSTCLVIVAAMLRKLNFQVVTMRHPYDALGTLRTRGGFDLVITDVHMPGINGFQLLLLISQEFHHLPVVLMSSDKQEGIVRQGMQNGAVSFIGKPVSMNDLKGLWDFVMKQKKQKMIVANNGDFRDNSGSGTRSSNPAGSDTPSVKKKMVWTDPLHIKFLDAVTSLGPENAVPKNILKAMNVPGLTRENVASHLQKYRLFLKRNIQQSQSRLGQKRVSRLAKLEHIFTQGQIDAALASAMTSQHLTSASSAHLTQSNYEIAPPMFNGTYTNWPHTTNSPSNSGGGNNLVPLSEHDEMMFYRGLTRDSNIENPNNNQYYQNDQWNGAEYPTLASILQNCPDDFLNNSAMQGATASYDNLNNNNNPYFYGNTNVDQVNGGYVAPENNDFLSSVLNFTDATDLTMNNQFGQSQAVGPEAFSVFGKGNGGGSYGNYGSGGPVMYDFPITNSGNANQGNNHIGDFANDFANHANNNNFNNQFAPNQQIGNGYGMSYEGQWYDYSNTNNQWYLGAQQNFNHQQYSYQTQREDNNDEFANAMFGSNPYGGAGYR